jgi:hypothetical protein
MLRRKLTLIKHVGTQTILILVVALERDKTKYLSRVALKTYVLSFSTNNYADPILAALNQT